MYAHDTPTMRVTSSLFAAYDEARRIEQHQRAIRELATGL
jgi:hypothetical protein